jgi:hypothetical protein
VGPACGARQGTNFSVGGRAPPRADMDPLWHGAAAHVRRGYPHSIECATGCAKVLTYEIESSVALKFKRMK